MLVSGNNEVEARTHPNELEDGTSFCYCADVLRILGYTGFLTNLPPNTKGAFAGAIRVQKENWR